jgi:CHAT domain-containing protein/Tfp pilus assembly protein PilF/predicted negative regulator of RcsB-dependent stress response
MSAFIKFVFCVIFLACTAVAQTARPPAQDLLTKAKQVYTQEGPKGALPIFEDALKIFRGSKDRHGEAITLGYIANCYRKLEDLDKALDFAQQALRMKEELGDRDEIGNTHNQLGLIYWERADYPAAIQNLQQAIKIGSSVSDKELEGSARNNLGLVFDERGDYKRSLEQYQRALELHRSTHFERGEGDTLGNIGGVYLLLGKFREALPYYQQALAISERLGLKPASSDDLGNIALCLAGSGDMDGALKTFDHALEVAHSTGLAKEEADWHRGKGTTLVGLGRFDAALREYSAAEQVYDHAGLKRELVEALADTGHVYELLGDGISAESRFQHALQLAKEIGNGSGETAGLLALGDLERRRKEYDAAETYFQQALERARIAGNDGTTGDAMIQRAMNDIDRKRYESALENASEASQLAERSGNRPAMALSHYVLGELRRSQGQLRTALEQYLSAKAIQEQLRDPELGWRIQYGQGQVLAAKDKAEDAIAAYKEAIRIIEDTRSGIAEERYRAGYIEDRYQVYVALVELLLKLHKPDDAFLYSEKLRARAYFDQMGINDPQVSDAGSQQRIRELGQQIRTLRRALEKEYAVPQSERREQALQLYSTELTQAEREYAAVVDDSRSSAVVSKSDQAEPIPSVAEIQHHLPEKTALVEYVVGKQSVSILLVTSTLVVGLPVQVPFESLSSRTELLRDLIAKRRAEWNEPASGLRKLLFDPLENAGYLSGVRQLLIVPDSVLNYVPFAALPLGKQRFLGDEFTLTYLPAAAALARNSRTNGRKLLAMAPSDAHLPNATAEVRGIGQIFGHDSRVILGKEATKTLFKQIAGNYDYLHLATHGSLNRNAPSLSALELEPDGQNDGRLEVYEIAGMKLHARLITLSACETGLGTGYFTETPGGDEFVGLTRAFLSAGGQNVLASLWAVNDQSSRDLMVHFYRHLLASSGAEALAKAQQELRRSDVRYRHPYYWAAFVMSGSIN